MPADIVNLNNVKKARDRAAKDKRAEENRAAYGRTKAQRRSDADEELRRTRLLDGARRGDGDEDKT